MNNLDSGIQEVVDRCRRIETRFTRFLIESGFDPGAQIPEWHYDGTIAVPSPSVSVKDILKVIPKDWPKDDEIIVMLKDEVLFSLYKGDDRTYSIPK